MAERIQQHDWAQTPLGPTSSWSPSLRMMVRFLLANRFPLLLWWGPKFCSIYNDAYRPILGSKHPQSLGQPLRECWHEIWHVLQPLVERPYQGGPSTWMEDIQLEINRHGRFEETHFTIAYSPVPDETVEGGIGGVLATVHEITENVIAERRVAALRDLGAHALDAKSADGACAAAAQTFAGHAKDVPFALLYLVDANGRSARLAGTTGVVAGEAAAPATIDLRADSGAPEAWPLAEVIATQEGRVVDDLASCLDGAVPPGPWADAPTEAYVVPIRSSLPHQIAGVLVAGVSARIALDESYKSFIELAASQISTAIASAHAYEEERRRAEALAEIDRAKTAFFSNVSHEFRTPLTLLLGPLEDALARAEGDTLPDAKPLIELSHRNGLRLLKLVNALLDFSRIEAGRTTLSPEPTDLAELTREQASMFRSAMEKAGLDYRVETSALPQAVSVDRDAWEKIVLNLVSNAFKFTLEGSVSVCVRSEGDTAILEVSDTGIGIGSEDLDRVFTRFHRIENARGRTHEGTGIGLSLVRELVRLHEGEITVESEAGRGSTFRVSLPMTKQSTEAPAVKPADATAGEPWRSSGEHARAFIAEALRWLPDEPHQGSERSELATTSGRVLLADDNADARQYVRGLLEAAGHVVETVPNGLEALASARRARPDLILTDVMMPELDGFGLLAAVRSDPSLAETPVIVLSARAGEESRVEGLQRGADDYLVKPFAARELVARVDSILGLARFRHESTARVTSVLESLTDGFSTFDREGRIQYANGAMRRIWAEQGISAESVLGRGMFEAFPDARGTDLGDAFEQVMAEREYVELETYYPPFDRWYAARFSPTPEGGMSLLVSDVTDRKHAEHALRQRTSQFETLLNRAPLGAFLVDDSFRIVEVNPTALPLFGDIVDLVGRDFGEVMHILWPSSYAEEVVAEFRRTRDTGMPYFVPERAEFRADRPGVREVYEWQIHRTAMPGGGFGVVCYIRDISAQVVAREERQQLLESERAARMESERLGRLKDDFLATLSHELRTPLHSIQGWAHLLRTDAQNERLREKGLEVIERNSRAQAQLISDLLDMSRIISGKLRLEFAPVDLPLVIEAAADSLRPAADAKGIRIETAAGPLRGAVHGDAERVQQMVWNLLSNAIKFTSPGGCAKVELSDTSEGASIRVTDDGKGIKAEFLPHLFERFRQEDSSAARVHGGLGIGLALVKQLVGLHGGEVRAESEGEGRGSRFEIVLPYVPERPGVGRGKDRPGLAATPDVGTLPRLEDVKVLVVDDEPDAREFVKRLLEEAQADVLVAGTAEEALELLRREKPQVLLSDVGMPGRDGYEFIREVRMSGSSIPAAALTAFARPEDRTRALLSGFQAHVPKPVEPAELLLIVASLAGRMSR
jgi:PAS domain S-box-containing protein